MRKIVIISNKTLQKLIVLIVYLFYILWVCCLHFVDAFCKSVCFICIYNDVARKPIKTHQKFMLRNKIW